jgi:magnesium transporter
MPEGESELPGSLAELLEQEGLDRETLRRCLASVHPVDLAELLDDVDLEDRARIFDVLDADRAAQVLAAMPHDYKVQLVDRLGEDRLGPVIDRMPDYAVADILDHLPQHKERQVLQKLEKEKASDVAQLRQYPEHTAGGRMTKNFVAVPDDFTAGQTIKAIQGAVDSHTVDFVYVVDEEGRLRGVLSLSKLMIHTPETPVAQFMRKDVTFVGPGTDQEEVAKLAQKYRLRHVPVVDNDMKMLGVVTLQDIIDVIRHEANEDIMKMAGAEHVDPLRAPFFQRVKARLPWLGAAMALELLIAWIMKAYGATLEHLALAYFIPVIMAMGGSLGLQSSTIVVRGLATGDISVTKAFRVVTGEFRIGLLIGLLAGSVTGLMALLMHLGVAGATMLALIVFLSMMVSLCVAATMGALTPLALQRMKMDPAVASGPFITAVNDVVNVTIYLTMATLLIVKAAPK